MMTVATSRKKQDSGTKQIYQLLRTCFPDISSDVNEVIYRFNSVSVRVLIVSSRFDKLDKKQRTKMFDDAMNAADPKLRAVINDITILLLLTPEELSHEDTRFDWLFIEFHNPRESRL